MTTTMPPIKFGCAGMGGFAGSVCDRLLSFSQASDALIRLTGVCDPNPAPHPQRVESLRAAGVQIFTSFDQLLDGRVDAVWLPLPIPLHRPFTEQALACGKAVLCEKPAAGSVQDVDAMIHARDPHNGFAAVGFQDVYNPHHIALQQRLARGDFGAPRFASLIGCWPRGVAYYARNDWAGRLRRNRSWILDSPASNALAHFIHLTLFLLSTIPGQPPALRSMSAELYRANEIESFDSCCISVRLETGATFLSVLSHACDQTIDPEIQILTDSHRLVLLPNKRLEIARLDGTAAVEMHSLESDRYANVIGGFTARLRRQPGAPVGGTLEMARAHVLLVNAAVDATPIVDVPPGACVTTITRDGSPANAIRDLPALFHKCIAEERMLNEVAQALWTRPAGQIDLSAYTAFLGINLR